MSVGYILGAMTTTQYLANKQYYFVSLYSPHHFGSCPFKIYSQSQLTTLNLSSFFGLLPQLGTKMGTCHTFLCLFLVTLSYIISLSNAYSFSAGGKNGWILSPSESYDAWSKRQRFVIGDIISKSIHSLLQFYFIHLLA